jgi:hypothetical protein
MHATLTNLERGQLNELMTRLNGYRSLCDKVTTNDDRIRAIAGVKEIRRQIDELQSRISFRKMAS